MTSTSTMERFVPKTHEFVRTSFAQALLKKTLGIASSRGIKMATPLKSNNFEDLIFAHVHPEPNSGCWFWMGALFRTGYGAVRYMAETHRAHRISFMLTKGAIPNGKYVLHHCDIKCCVNPDHLFLGDQFDNFMDSQRKGRLWGAQTSTWECK